MHAQDVTVAFARSSGARLVTVLLVAVIAMCSFVVAAPVRAAGIVYVTPGGTGDGSSWAAGRDLAPALIDAISGDELWVAAGTYHPTTTKENSHLATFQLKPGVAIYGGFAGTETRRDQRNWVTNVVTLSGDILQPGHIEDNSYHVVSGADDAILDGVTITGGYANGNWREMNTYGGGMINVGTDPVLSNIVIRDNIGGFGGGMYNDQASPTLINVTITSNIAGSGGGMYNYAYSNPTLTNITISGNTARGGSLELGGGGMANIASDPTLTNVIISGNIAPVSGAMSNYDSSPTLTNVTISGNISSGGAMSNISQPNDSSRPTIRNSIVWNNAGGSITGDVATVSDSLIEGRYAGSNILDIDPHFVTPIDPASAPTTESDLHLKPTSPAVNHGNNTVANPALPATDRDGNPRIVGGTVDLGAYEALPTLVSILRANATPTSAATVAFTVTFTIPVVGVDATDFALMTTGEQASAAISRVTGIGTTWWVDVATAPSSGTIRLDLIDKDTIFTTDTPPVPLGGVGNSGLAMGETYVIFQVASSASTRIFLPIVKNE